MSENNDNRAHQILQYIKQHGEITGTDTEQLLDVSASTASRLIKKLVDEGILIPSERARNIKYTTKY